MSVSLESDIIRLEGACRVEDAEPLLMLLRENPCRTVDMSGAGLLHAAVVQVLLALRPAIAGTVSDPFVAMWLMPLLTRA